MTTRYCWLIGICLLIGCDQAPERPAVRERPFPNTFWEEQQTNAEATDFVFQNHEFLSESEEIFPRTKRHLEEVALRWEHVPFPVVIQPSQYQNSDDLDQSRRQTIVAILTRMGISRVDERVVVGLPQIEETGAKAATLPTPRRFGGTGGMYR